jgi:hypothetical protein
MRTFKTLSIALVLAVGAAGAAGCSGSEVDDQDDDDDDDDDDDVTPDEPTSAVGKYAVTSEFDMVTGLPGTVGDVINGFIDATDGSDDPGRWLCDLAADQLSDPWDGYAHTACSFAAGYINDRLLEIAPDFVDTLIALGNDFGQISKNFGTTSELDVTMPNGSLIATHTLDGVVFTLEGGSPTALKFADYGIENVATPNVGITYDPTGRIDVLQHDLPVKFGAVLRLAVDEILIPQIDPLATDLPDLFDRLVDCYPVAVAIQEAVGFGSVSMYESACEAGLRAAGNLVYGQLENLDGNAMKFGIAGQARATDNNSDDLIDMIDRGEWTGAVDYAGTIAPLQNSTFAATRK